MGKKSREKRERRERGEGLAPLVARTRIAAWSPAWRDQVAEAVHAGVCRAFGEEEAPLLCWVYAVSGAMALNLLADAIDTYTYTAGTLRVRTGVEDGYLTLDPNYPRDAGVEYHAWIVSTPQGPQRGIPIETPPDMEVIDLSARHYATHAVAAGLPFNRPDLARYVWTRFGDLPAMGGPQGLYFSSNAEATLAIQHMWPRYEAALSGIVRSTLDRMRL